jgi:thiamine pyrophosphokinase
MTPHPDGSHDTPAEAPADLVVLVNGDPLPAALLPDLAAAIDAASATIAADGGLQHADRAGRPVDVVIGDLDSVDARALERARAAGTEVIEHPEDKDATDLDLALALALERWTAPDRPSVLVVGGHGGRLDHLLGNLLVLASDRYTGLAIRGWLGTDVIHVVRGTVELHQGSGATVSLLAVDGTASGVTTTGLRFPLHDATLEVGSSLGLSNTMVMDTATVTVRSGVVLTVQSHPPDPIPDPRPDRRSDS